MRRFTPALALALPLACVAAAPPRAPNYCGPAVCLQIPRSFGDVSITARSGLPADRVQAEVRLTGSKGVATIHVQETRGGSCTSAHELRLRRQGRAFAGGLLASGPDDGRCFRIDVAYVPHDAAPTVPAYPIAALWVVETAPVTSFAHGYALRLGPEVTVRYGPP